ncbi:MAG TPA: hypothetical protein VJC08_02545, partial [bacterium]|nr:hypothetical protein [bacterium]
MNWSLQNKSNKAVAAGMAFLMLLMPAVPWNPSQIVYAQIIDAEIETALEKEMLVEPGVSEEQPPAVPPGTDPILVVDDNPLSVVKEEVITQDPIIETPAVSPDSNNVWGLPTLVVAPSFVKNLTILPNDQARLDIIFSYSFDLELFKKLRPFMSPELLEAFKVDPRLHDSQILLALGVVSQTTEPVTPDTTGTSTEVSVAKEEPVIPSQPVLLPRPIQNSDQSPENFQAELMNWESTNLLRVTDDIGRFEITDEQISQAVRTSLEPILAGLSPEQLGPVSGMLNSIINALDPQSDSVSIDPAQREAVARLTAALWPPDDSPNTSSISTRAGTDRASTIADSLTSIANPAQTTGVQKILVKAIEAIAAGLESLPSAPLPPAEEPKPLPPVMYPTPNPDATDVPPTPPIALEPNQTDTQPEFEAMYNKYIQNQADQAEEAARLAAAATADQAPDLALDQRGGFESLVMTHLVNNGITDAILGASNACASYWSWTGGQCPNTSENGGLLVQLREKRVTGGGCKKKTTTYVESYRYIPSPAGNPHTIHLAPSFNEVNRLRAAGIGVTILAVVHSHPYDDPWMRVGSEPDMLIARTFPQAMHIVVTPSQDIFFDGTHDFLGVLRNRCAVGTCVGQLVQGQ